MDAVIAQLNLDNLDFFNPHLHGAVAAIAALSLVGWFVQWWFDRSLKFDPRYLYSAAAAGVAAYIQQVTVQSHYTPHVDLYWAVFWDGFQAGGSWYFTFHILKKFFTNPTDVPIEKVKEAVHADLVDAAGQLVEQAKDTGIPGNLTPLIQKVETAVTHAEEASFSKRSAINLAKELKIIK